MFYLPLAPCPLPLCNKPLIYPALYFKPVGVIVRNKPVCCIKDRLTRAVVFCKRNQFCIRVYFLKAQHIAYGSAAELIDGLVIVRNYIDIFVPFCQKFHKLKLGIVCILKFINKNVFEFFLVAFQNVRSCPEKL